MKKLLITTIAAASLAFCAKADFPENGTSFEYADEELKVGDSFLEKGVTSDASGNQVETGGYKPKDGWSTEASTDDGLFTITNVSDVTFLSRPKMWDGKANTKALAIDTSIPLKRGAILSGEAQDVSITPIFFDSVVQFTATDVAGEPAEEDKLRVWLYTSPDDVSETNPGLFNEREAIKTLVITAGVLERVSDGDNVVEDVKPKNYYTGIEIESESWHRLTIKSFLNQDKDKLMFNVWIDGATDPITAEGVTDFLSLVNPNGESDIKLQGVAFDGKGAVDDVVFTTTNPFAVEVADAPLNITFNDFSAIDETEGAWYVLNDDDDNTITISDDSTEATLKAGDKVSVWFKLLEGYELVSPEVEPDGDGFYTITIDALTADGATIAIVTKSAADGSAWKDNENFAADLTRNVAGLLENVYNKVTGEPTNEQAAYLMTTVGTASGNVTVKVGDETKAATDTFELSVGNNVKIQVPYYEVTEGVVKVATAIIALETVEITVGNESKLISPAITEELSVTGITSEKNVVGELSNNNVATVKVRDTTDPIKLAFNGVVSTDVFFTKKVYTKADASTTVAYGMTGLDDSAFWFYFQYGQNLDDLRSVWNSGSVNYKIGCYKKGIANVVMDITIDQQFTVKFMNGETVVQSTPVWNGEYVTAPSSNPEAPTGQQFVGWFNGNAEFDATDPVTANVNYTAKFEDTATYPSVGGVTTPEYSDNAKDVIDAAFPNNSYPTGGLTVEVNGEKLTGAKAVEMLNEAVEMFTLAEGAKFFDADGKLDISFKATGADPTKIAYEAKVGGLAATVNDTYEVVPKYIDIATNKELQAMPTEGSVTFRLVIKPVGQK